MDIHTDLAEVIFNNNNNNNNNNNVSVNKDENENENDNESVNDDDDDDDDDDDYHIIKQLSNYFKTIDETKSFKETLILMNIGILDIAMTIKN